jgi:hypothetical protein
VPERAATSAALSRVLVLGQSLYGSVDMERADEVVCGVDDVEH